MIIICISLTIAVSFLFGQQKEGSTPHFTRAQSLYKEGKLELAASEAKKAIEKTYSTSDRLKKAGLLLLMAKICMAQKNYAEALAFFEKAQYLIERDGDSGLETEIVQCVDKLGIEMDYLTDEESLTRDKNLRLMKKTNRTEFVRISSIEYTAVYVYLSPYFPEEKAFDRQELLLAEAVTKHEKFRKKIKKQWLDREVSHAKGWLRDWKGRRVRRRKLNQKYDLKPYPVPETVFNKDDARKFDEAQSHVDKAAGEYWKTVRGKKATSERKLKWAGHLEKALTIYRDLRKKHTGARYQFLDQRIREFGNEYSKLSRSIKRKKPKVDKKRPFKNKKDNASYARAMKLIKQAGKLNTWRKDGEPHPKNIARKLKKLDKAIPILVKLMKKHPEKRYGFIHEQIQMAHLNRVTAMSATPPKIEDD